MIDTFMYEWENRNKKIAELIKQARISNNDFYQCAISQLEFLRKAEPNNVNYVSQQAEFFHLDGYLRKAGERYREVLEMDPLIQLTEKEEEFIRKFCPN